MSRIALHTNYVRVGRGELRRWEYRGADKCPACLQVGRCKGCQKPFTISTAEDEENYCSLWCEGVREK